MKEIKDYQGEILEQIAIHYPEHKDASIGDFKQIMGGADTTTFGFDFISGSESIPLILRIFRPIYSDGAKREFEVMKNLYAENISIPKPYICVEQSDVSDSAYIIMERIEGNLLSDALHNAQNTPRFDILLESFVRNLVAINSVEWRKNFTFLDYSGIDKNPDLFIRDQLAHPRKLILDHKIDTLLPVIEWLKENQPVLQVPCLLHSDYHGLNVLIRKDDSLVTIDWSNAKIGDFRYDLGFAILALSSMVGDVSNKLVKFYETISGRQVENVEYFIVLSSLWNLLRIYSGLYDPKITGENEVTIGYLAREFFVYASAIIRITQETTGVSLAKLLDDLTGYASKT